MGQDEHDLFEWNLVDSLSNLPDRLAPTAWSGHISFLFSLFRIARPRSFVELGVYNGASFIAACTAARIYETETICFGIDTWQGDEHAGDYSESGDSIFCDLKSFLSENYQFAKLIRSTFDSALNDFADGTIDMLHIDGMHTYEAVKGDFESWLPKMSSRGIVLFHDTSVRERNFGVWRFWEEVTEEYPSMEFFHSFGLGVLLVGRDQVSSMSVLIQRWNESVSFKEFFRATCEGFGALVPDRVQARENINRIRWLESDRQQKEVALRELQHLREIDRIEKEAQFESLRHLQEVELLVENLTRRSRLYKLLRPILLLGHGFRELEKR
ncbi:MAG: class I SAM-dependent methyltransferase [Bdellovibrionales bacterium]|nr:class I SAM-dependent methyltransferase [Bdellovibrionales bacterium]